MTLPVAAETSTGVSAASDATPLTLTLTVAFPTTAATCVPLVTTLMRLRCPLSSTGATVRLSML